MPVKTAIIDELGESELLLPRRLEEALAANDRLKYYFALLQSAEEHARHPENAPPDLAGERKAAGVEDSHLDTLVAASRREPEGMLYSPGASILGPLIRADLAAMLEPLHFAADDGAQDFARRLAAITAALPDFANDRLPAARIAEMTAAERGQGDSAHLLVMDMHRALNALQGRIASETIAGAKVYGLAPDDKALVAAFMSGIDQTAPLKFEHPGLGTTATRVGERLVIQNDIGTTDAHVLVLHVEGLATTLTYTDIHPARADFFQSLFKPFEVVWEDARTRRSDHLTESANYVLCVGNFTAGDAAELARYLAFLASRIVFLIDWNKARKRLREFLREPDAVVVLKWAADHNFGHRAFLKLGGERLLFEAIEHAQPSTLHYGERLHEALGAEAAVGFLKFVLRTSAEGLLQGRTEQLIRDEIRAELGRYFKTVQEGLMTIAADHAALIFELATATRDALVDYGLGEGARPLERLARRARKWEQSADELVIRTRSIVRRTRQPDFYISLLREADDAADGLEEAAFLMTLLPSDAGSKALLQPVETLASLLVDGAQEFLKCLAAAGQIHRGGAREDLQDFLEAVDRVVFVEHATDDADRAVTAAIVRDAADFRQLHVLDRLANTFEEAADALSRCALMLRDHILNDVMAA